MSALFAGPNKLTPWIEKTVCQVLLGSDERCASSRNCEIVPTRPKLVQVISLNVVDREEDEKLGANNCNKGRRTMIGSMVISDCEHTITAILSPSARKLLAASAEDLPSKGCAVRINGWKVASTELLEYCGSIRDSGSKNNASTALLSDNHRSYHSSSRRFCLHIAGSVETIGGHGSGVAGEPIEVNQSIDVRRIVNSFSGEKYNLLLRQLRKHMVSSNKDRKIAMPKKSSPLPLVAASPATEQQRVANSTSSNSESSKLPVANVAAALVSGAALKKFPWQGIYAARRQQQHAAATDDHGIGAAARKGNQDDMATANPQEQRRIDDRKIGSLSIENGVRRRQLYTGILKSYRRISQQQQKTGKVNILGDNRLVNNTATNWPPAVHINNNNDNNEVENRTQQQKSKETTIAEDTTTINVTAKSLPRTSLMVQANPYIKTTPHTQIEHLLMPEQDGDNNKKSCEGLGISDMLVSQDSDDDGSDNEKLQENYQDEEEEETDVTATGYNNKNNSNSSKENHQSGKSPSIDSGSSNNHFSSQKESSKLHDKESGGQEANDAEAAVATEQKPNSHAQCYGNSLNDEEVYETQEQQVVASFAAPNRRRSKRLWYETQKKLAAGQKEANDSGETIRPQQEEKEPTRKRAPLPSSSPPPPARENRTINQWLKCVGVEEKQLNLFSPDNDRTKFRLGGDSLRAWIGHTK